MQSKKYHQAYTGWKAKMLWVWMYGSEKARKVTGLRTNLRAMFIPGGFWVTACVRDSRYLSVSAWTSFNTTGTEHSLLGSLWNRLSVSPGVCRISMPGPFPKHKPWPSLGMWQLCRQLAFIKPERQNSWLRPVKRLSPRLSPLQEDAINGQTQDGNLHPAEEAASSV